jgi:hypothetical protein
MEIQDTESWAIQVFKGPSQWSLMDGLAYGHSEQARCTSVSRTILYFQKVTVDYMKIPALRKKSRACTRVWIYDLVVEYLTLARPCQSHMLHGCVPYTADLQPSKAFLFLLLTPQAKGISNAATHDIRTS